MNVGKEIGYVVFSARSDYGSLTRKKFRTLGGAKWKIIDVQDILVAPRELESVSVLLS